MIVPVDQDLYGVKGSAFDVTFTLWQNTARTQKYTITETVTFEIWNETVASEGSGITITDNAIAVHLDHTETEYSSVDYRLKLVDDKGEPFYPIHGVIRFEKP